MAYPITYSSYHFNFFGGSRGCKKCGDMYYSNMYSIVEMAGSDARKNIGWSRM